MRRRDVFKLLGVAALVPAVEFKRVMKEPVAQRKKFGTQAWVTPMIMLASAADDLKWIYRSCINTLKGSMASQGYIQEGEITIHRKRTYTGDYDLPHDTVTVGASCYGRPRTWLEHLRTRLRIS